MIGTQSHQPKDLIDERVDVATTFQADQMDFQVMGQTHNELAQTGAWGCFDEFKRIPEAVLSVCCMQYKPVLDAIRAREERFLFTDVEIALQPSVMAFITIDPGYPGRGELPDPAPPRAPAVATEEVRAQLLDVAIDIVGDPDVPATSPLMPAGLELRVEELAWRPAPDPLATRASAPTSPPTAPPAPPGAPASATSSTHTGWDIDLVRWVWCVAVIVFYTWFLDRVYHTVLGGSTGQPKREARAERRQEKARRASALSASAAAPAAAPRRCGRTTVRAPGAASVATIPSPSTSSPSTLSPTTTFSRPSSGPPPLAMQMPPLPEGAEEVPCDRAALPEAAAEAEGGSLCAGPGPAEPCLQLKLLALELCSLQDPAEDPVSPLEAPQKKRAFGECPEERPEGALTSDALTSEIFCETVGRALGALRAAQQEVQELAAMPATSSPVLDAVLSLVFSAVLLALTGLASICRAALVCRAFWDACTSAAASVVTAMATCARAAAWLWGVLMLLTLSLVLGVVLIAVTLLAGICGACTAAIWLGRMLIPWRFSAGDQLAGVIWRMVDSGEEGQCIAAVVVHGLAELHGGAPEQHLSAYYRTLFEALRLAEAGALPVAAGAGCLGDARLLAAPTAFKGAEDALVWRDLLGGRVLKVSDPRLSWLGVYSALHSVVAMHRTDACCPQRPPLLRGLCLVPPAAAELVRGRQEEALGRAPRWTVEEHLIPEQIPVLVVLTRLAEEEPMSSQVATNPGAITAGALQAYLHRVVCELAAMHEAFIIHRDIKLENTVGAGAMIDFDNGSLADFEGGSWEVWAGWAHLTPANEAVIDRAAFGLAEGGAVDGRQLDQAGFWSLVRLLGERLQGRHAALLADLERACLETQHEHFPGLLRWMHHHWCS